MSDLPFDTDDDEKTPPEPATLASNVLVVDDEPVVRDVFQRLLAREQDMVVVVAEDAEQGLELIKKQRFELLVTDKNLPGMGGIELIAEARAVRPSIEAVMITGYASSESLISAFAAGASDYLVKPFDDLKVVRAKVRAALQRRLDRRQSQISSKDMARQAAALLGQGKDAPEAVWRKLDTKFAEYERAIRDGGAGRVIVVGATDRTVQTLAQGGVQAQQVEPGSPDVLAADVVVIETGPQLDWHPLAEKLMPLSPDVVLVAGPESDLSDLLEAISLRVDLVGFGGHAPARLLPDRIRANLMRRSVERAQKELAIALHEFKQSLRARQEEPLAETVGHSAVEVSPPLAALAAVPLVNRPAVPVAPSAVPSRAPVTPQLPMPVVMARPSAAASPSPRAPVTPAAPMSATPAAPAAPARTSTPVPGASRPPDAAGGTPKAAAPGVPPAGGASAVPRRPTGSHPQLAPPEEPAPGGVKRPTGWHPIIPLEDEVAAPGASGGVRAPDASASRHISGAFPQAAPPGGPGAGAAPRKQTPGASPQVAPPDAPGAGTAPRRPTPGSSPQVAPADAPSAAGAARRPAGVQDPVSGAMRRPTGSFPAASPDAGRAPAPGGFPAASPDAGRAPAPGGFPPASPAGGATASGGEDAAGQSAVIQDPVSGAIRRPSGSYPVISHEVASLLVTPQPVAPSGSTAHRPAATPGPSTPLDAGAHPGSTAPRPTAAPGRSTPPDPLKIGTPGAMRRPTGSFPAASPDASRAPAPGGFPGEGASAPGGGDPARRPAGAPDPGVARRPTGPHPAATPPPEAAPGHSTAPEPEPDLLPLEWAADPSAITLPPADPRSPIPLVTPVEPEISIDDAFLEWEVAEKKPTPAPPPPAPAPAPARRTTGSFPQATPQDNAARRKAASPFPIMSVAEAESALKAAQAQAAAPVPPAPAKPPQAPPPAASTPARRSTGSSPANPNPAPPAAPAPRAPLQGRPAVRHLPPTQAEPATEPGVETLGGPPPGKPKPPNGDR